MQRRTHTRYRAVCSSFVVFEAPRQNLLIRSKVIDVGPVNEISRMGMSIEYQPTPEIEKAIPELSILVPGQGVVAYRIPFRTITDLPLGRGHARKEIRRLGLRFNDLDTQHIQQLEHFIQTYTRHALPDRRTGHDRRSEMSDGVPDLAISGNRSGLENRRTGIDRRRKKGAPVMMNWKNDDPNESACPTIG